MADATAVDPQDSSKQNSPIVDMEAESTVALDSANAVCMWNGQEFKDGSKVTTGGTTYECSFGNWVKS